MLLRMFPGRYPFQVGVDGLVHGPGAGGDPFRMPGHSPSRLQLDPASGYLQQRYHEPGVHADGCFGPEGRNVFARAELRDGVPFSSILATQPGGIPVQISEGPGDYAPACAPDGSAVAWVSARAASRKCGSADAFTFRSISLVTAGLMNKQVAGELGVAEITAKVHRSNIMRKMGARSLADLVRMADAIGIRQVTH